MRGDTYGVSTWAKWQVTDWWRLSPGLRLLYKDLEFKPGSNSLLGVEQASNDATSHASLASSMDLGSTITMDIFLRYVDELPDPPLDAYYEMNARIGWQMTPLLNLSLTGSNLLHSRHRESPAASDSEISRGVFAEARWSFE
jgi:iron complex outermembrane recepter protein